MSDPKDKCEAAPEDLSSQTVLEMESPFAKAPPAAAGSGLTPFPLPKPPPGAGLFDESETTAPGDSPAPRAAPAPAPGTDLASSTVRTAPALIDEPLPAPAASTPPGSPAPFSLPKSAAGFGPASPPARSTHQTDLPPGKPASAKPDPAESTLLLDRAPSSQKSTSPELAAFPVPKTPAAFEPDAASTRLLDLPSEAAPAAKEPAKKLEAPGAYSRKQAEAPPKEAPAPEAERSATAEVPIAPVGINPAQKKALIVLGALAAAFLLYLVFGTTTFRDVPRRADLELAYPYGINGARGTHGQIAPGALEVEYDYVESVSCMTYSKCVRYRYSQGESFEGTMILGKRFNGDWERTSDEGMPFRKREQ